MELQATLDAGRTAQKILGVVAMVVTPVGAWKSASGFADVRKSIPMPPTGHFRIGSITKTFTAAVALELVQEGRLDLATTVDRWLPALPNAASITVRQLLDHTSGLFDYAADPAADALGDRPPPQAFLDIAARHPADFAPGSSWEYSNTNYVALGVILERVTGHSFAAEIAARLTTPLGLSDTYLPEGMERPGLVQGARLDGEAYTDITNTTYGKFYFADGGLTSSVDDVLAWNEALVDGKVLGPAALAQMTTVTPASRDGLGPGTGYGLGLMVTSTSLGTEYGHGGGMYGFVCNTIYYKDLGIGVAVLTNSDEADPYALGEQLAAIAAKR
jgi:D-alanyl-D-alanine carboxypeptidase